MPEYRIYTKSETVDIEQENAEAAIEAFCKYSRLEPQASFSGSGFGVYRFKHDVIFVKEIERT